MKCYYNLTFLIQLLKGLKEEYLRGISEKCFFLVGFFKKVLIKKKKNIILNRIFLNHFRAINVEATSIQFGF